jgi:hypothetical protein
MIVVEQIPFYGNYEYEDSEEKIVQNARDIDSEFETKMLAVFDGLYPNKLAIGELWDLFSEGYRQGYSRAIHEAFMLDEWVWNEGDEGL